MSEESPRCGAAKRGVRFARSSVRNRSVVRTPTALVLALSLSLGACVAPTRTPSSYRDKAVDTADAVVSAARTVLLAAETGGEGNAFAPNVAVLIADAESDADAAESAFASIQPPDAASDRLRSELLDDVRRAVDVIELTRIAARRAELGSLEDVAAPLHDLADRLEAFSERYG
jgi:hypothetical protein